MADADVGDTLEVRTCDTIAIDTAAMNVVMFVHETVTF